MYCVCVVPAQGYKFQPFSLLAAHRQLPFQLHPLHPLKTKPSFSSTENKQLLRRSLEAISVRAALSLEVRAWAPRPPQRGARGVKQPLGLRRADRQRGSCWNIWILRVRGQAEARPHKQHPGGRMGSCWAASHAWSSRAVGRGPSHRAPSQGPWDQNSQRTDQEKSKTRGRPSRTGTPNSPAAGRAGHGRPGSQAVFAELVAEVHSAPGPVQIQIKNCRALSDGE